MKKAGLHLSAEMVLWIPRLVFLIAVTIAVIFFIRAHTSRTLDVYDTEANILVTRLVYSPYCLAYKDVRAYPGIIDINKFTNERVKNCINYEKDYPIFKVILEDLNGETISEISNTDKIIDPNLCDMENKDFKCFRDKNYILIKYQNEIKNAILKTVVITYA